MEDKTMQVRLVMDMTVKLNGEQPETIRGMVSDMPHRAIGDGMVTGESAAELVDWTSRLESVPDTDVNWKQIATEMLRDLEFALMNLRPRHGWTGALFNLETGECKGWRTRIMETMLLYPGITLDRELIEAQDLPRKEYRKWLAERRAKVAAEISSEDTAGETTQP